MKIKWFCQGLDGVPIQRPVIKVKVNHFVEQLQNDDFHYPKSFEAKNNQYAHDIRQMGCSRPRRERLGLNSKQITYLQHG
jgi:hypothetical protein